MNIWRLIAHHLEPEQAVEEMARRSRIAVGWTDTGDINGASPQSASEITRLISRTHPDLDNAHLGGPSLWSLYHRMAIGDLVILGAAGRRLAVFEVVGPYLYVPEDEWILGYAHQRAAVPTEIHPDELWVYSESGIVEGENIRWTLVACTALPAADEAIYREGRRFSVTSTAVERSPAARSACIKHHGPVCAVCEVNFESRYGPLGTGYIHVHHMRQLARTTGEVSVDPVNDLIPLCPNCHAMVHQESPPMDVSKLRRIYEAHNA